VKLLNFSLTKTTQCALQAVRLAQLCPTELHCWAKS